MSFPLGENGWISAIILGFLFGFALERAGLTNSRKLLSQFDFSDWTVLKVMFGAIAVAAVGIAAFQAAGLIEEGSVFVPAAYLGSAAIGGLLVGAGMGTAGYCPGTCMASAATGKWDALSYLAGIVAGTYLFSFAFPLMDDITTLGGVEGSDTLSDALSIPSLAIAAVIAIAAALVFVIGGKLEKKSNAARLKALDVSRQKTANSNKPVGKS